MACTPTHAAGVKLQRIVKKIRRHLFVFVTNRDIPATNNGSERALRPCAVFRKITNGFRTEWGAKLYADIRSVIETARRRAIGVLEAIRLTLAGMPFPNLVLTARCNPGAEQLLKFNINTGGLIISGGAHITMRADNGYSVTLYRAVHRVALAIEESKC